MLSIDVPGAPKGPTMGRTAPPNIDAAVRYGQAWFWIDDGDFVAYTILGLPIALVQGAPTGQAPVLTIPAG